MVMFAKFPIFFTMKKSSPPKKLSAEGKRLWRSILEEFEVSDSAGLLLLGTALESFDEMRTAQKILEVDGQVIEDRFHQKRQHPATLIVRDARNLMLRSLKALNLDIRPDSPLRGGS
jgi:P27 family predicted phage terminase small subunit